MKQQNRQRAVGAARRAARTYTPLPYGRTQAWSQGRQQWIKVGNGSGIAGEVFVCTLRKSCFSISVRLYFTFSFIYDKVLNIKFN